MCHLDFDINHFILGNLVVVKLFRNRIHIESMVVNGSIQAEFMGPKLSHIHRYGTPVLVILLFT